MVCRDPAKGEAALAEVRTKSDNRNVSLMLADLGSQQAIRDLFTSVSFFIDDLQMLDCWMRCIAGCRKLGDGALTVAGDDAQRIVNFMSHPRSQKSHTGQSFAFD